MGLSYDLISEFVKITNDKKDDKKEGTVYATVVSGTGGKYVRIDGSDLLTPMDTTTDIEDGERVTLMIKDHKAIVTGNVTTPSASTSKVDKVTESVNSVSDRVGTFELVVADKVSTNELEAYKATIEVLIANKATIEDLTATNAKIENLEVKNAEIENLVAEKATIEDLEAVNATIENLKVKDAEIENAVVENLKATTADIKILNADFAQIKTLVNGNLTSDNILSFNLTSGKVTVDDAFIKDAMIDTISAGKINAGKINTNSVSIGSEDGGMLITGSTQQFTDKNGNVRIQIGKDTSGDFTFILYGEDGKGQLINQNGITASAISDGLIINDMVSDNAAISGGKLDISSVIFEINNDTSTTIKSSKIYLNEQAQSLEVAFNSLKTKVDTIQEVTIQGDLTAIVEQVQSNTSKIEANKDSINTLISQDTVIKKQVTDLQGTLNETETTLNSKYTSLSQNLNGFKTTVADTYATKKSVTDVVDNISANYSTTSVMNSAIEQKAQEISASVSSTYATKNQVNTLDNNLKSNYSTTRQMESAINIAKEAINLGVSSIYETKTNVETKINGIQIGGRNFIKDSNKRLNSKTPTSVQLGGVADYQKLKGKTVTLSMDINVSGMTDISGQYNRIGFECLLEYTDGTNTCLGIWHYSSEGNFNGRKTSIMTIPDKDIKSFGYCGIYMQVNATSCDAGNVKLEIGNKATDWTPAPEDISADISTAKQEAITSANNTLTSTISNYYTKSQTDSQINIAKEAINLGVSTTYETKENVQTKVTSTLNSAKSYADTKKTEAINTAASDATAKANNAKSEAIKSANNTLTSTISNYYTKAQTDSQINVAKEAINLGVSTTYETKSNVATKVSNAIATARGITDTRSTNENPKWYMDNFPSQTINEFKQGSVIGIPISSSNTYGTLITNVPWSDSSGSYPFQTFKSSNFKTYERKGTSNTTWGEWVQVENAIDSQTKANTAKQQAIDSANSTLTSTIANYYTKSQTDSQINVAKDAINLGVSRTYETKTNVETKINGIQIGGRNLIKGSNKRLNATTPTSLQLGGIVDYQKLKGKTVTLSLDINVRDMTNVSGDYNRVGFECILHHTDGTNTCLGIWHYSSEGNFNGRKTSIMTIPDKDIKSFGYNGLYMQCNATSCDMGNVKLELGNKATDWTPAPEDMEDNVQNTKKEVIETLNKAVSTLQLNTDSINASVMSLDSTMKNNFNGVQNDIQTIQNKVNLAMTSADVKLEIKKEMEKGTNKVTTGTGFTFDNNGLRIDKTDSEMATQITENGMTITKNDNVVLTANNQGVDAVNLHATTYLIIGGNSRIEDFGSNRTACFWIGN